LGHVQAYARVALEQQLEGELHERSAEVAADAEMAAEAEGNGQLSYASPIDPMEPSRQRRAQPARRPQQGAGQQRHPEHRG
jgi:hypothetical protein